MRWYVLAVVVGLLVVLDVAAGGGPVRAAIGAALFVVVAARAGREGRRARQGHTASPLPTQPPIQATYDRPA